MKITEKHIEAYAKANNEKVVKIDWEKEEVLYDNGRFEIKGFFSNVQDFLSSLIQIGDKIYFLPEWLREKNSLKGGEKLELIRETEKAVLVASDEDEFWLPKSQLKEVELTELPFGYYTYEEMFNLPSGTIVTDGNIAQEFDKIRESDLPREEKKEKRRALRRQFEPIHHTNLKIKK